MVVLAYDNQDQILLQNVNAIDSYDQLLHEGSFVEFVSEINVAMPIMLVRMTNHHINQH